jgi:hypothetical protein
MFLKFYDIIAKVIAAHRFVASALLVPFGKCHETCGCITFREICVVRCYPNSVSNGASRRMTLSANRVTSHC